MILSSHNSFIFLDLKMYFSSCDSRYREIHYDLKVGNWNYNSYDEYDYSIQCYREINQSFVVLIIMDISSIIWTKFRWWSRRENSWFWSSRWAEKHGERGVQRGNFADSLRNHDRLSYLRGWIHFVGKCYNCGRYNFKKKIHGFIFLFLIYINRRDCWF